MAVRRHGAAGMLVRVDQRPERLGAFQPGIELQPQLARERQVRPLPRRHDDAVDRPDPPHALHGIALDDHPAAIAPHCRGGEAGDQRHAPVVDERLHVGAELAARRQLVGFAAAIDAHQVRAAHRPDDGRRRFRFGEPGEVEQRIRRRMPRADHQHCLAGIAGAVAAEHVGNAIGDPLGMLRLAVGRQSAAAERVLVRPGARGVDHRPREIAPDTAVAGVDRQQERPLLAPAARHLVHAEARHRDHAHACLDRRAPSRASPPAASDSARRGPRRSACPRPAAPATRLPPAVSARPHRCCSATARRCAHGPSRARSRRPSPRPHRRERAGRARSAARPPQARSARRRSPRREAPAAPPVSRPLWGSRNAGSSGSLLHLLNFRNLRNTSEKREAHAASLPSPDAQESSMQHSSARKPSSPSIAG